MVVVIVEAHLAPADHARMAAELFELREMLVGGGVRVVRMDADGRVDPVVLLGERNRGVEAISGRCRCRWRATLCTPAARARSSMAARSSSNCGNSRCACESMISKGMIFQLSIRIQSKTEEGFFAASNDGARLQRQNQM